MAYPEQYTLGETAGFRQRVQVAVADVAADLLVSGSPTSGQRAAAQRILDDLRSADAVAPIVVQVARMVVTDDTVAASAPTGAALTDAQLRSAVQTYLAALVR